MVEYQCTVLRQDELDQTHYVFVMLRREVVLDAVYQYHRVSRRHKWRRVGKWSRVFLPEPHATAIDKPTVPDDVLAEVRKDLSELRIVV